MRAESVSSLQLRTGQADAHSADIPTIMKALSFLHRHNVATHLRQAIKCRSVRDLNLKHNWPLV
jgi:hypothetical protein